MITGRVEDIPVKIASPGLPLVLITLAAAGLRFLRLGDWSLWGDEAFTLSLREDGFNYSLLRRSLASTLIQWSAAHLGATEWYARLFPALIGLLSVPLLYVLLRRLTGREAALATSLLLAVSPWHVYWSQNARFYSLLLLFYTCALVLFFSALENDRPWQMAAALVFFALAGRERLLALFLLPTVIGYLLLLWLLRFEKPRGLNRRNLLIFFAPLVLVAGVLAGPYLANLGAWRANFGPANNSPLVILAGVLLYTGLPLAVVAGLGGLALLLRRDRAGLYFLLGALTPLAGMMVIALFHYSANRYVFVSLTSWVILGGLALRELALHGRRVLFAAAVVLLVSAATDLSLYYSVQKGNRDDWKGALSYVQANRQPDDVVVMRNQDIASFYLHQNASGYFEVNFDPFSLASRRVWFIEDNLAAETSPAALAWVHANARLMAVRDVPFQTRVFRMRVYLYSPGEQKGQNP